jgi:hypothetical protein
MKSNIHLFLKMVTHSSDASELMLKNEIFSCFLKKKKDDLFNKQNCKEQLLIN